MTRKRKPTCGGRSKCKLRRQVEKQHPYVLAYEHRWTADGDKLFGLWMALRGSAAVRITHCPWCGRPVDWHSHMQDFLRGHR